MQLNHVFRHTEHNFRQPEPSSENTIRKDSVKMGCMQNFSCSLRASPYLVDRAACINELENVGLANVVEHRAAVSVQRQRVEPETNINKHINNQHIDDQILHKTQGSIYFGSFINIPANSNICAGDRIQELALDTSDRCLQTSPYLTKVDDCRAACFNDLDDSRLNFAEKIGQPSNDHNKRVDPANSIFYAGDGAQVQAVDMRQLGLANSNFLKNSTGDQHNTKDACFQLISRHHRGQVNYQGEGVQITSKDKSILNSASNNLSEPKHTDLKEIGISIPNHMSTSSSSASSVHSKDLESRSFGRRKHFDPG